LGLKKRLGSWQINPTIRVKIHSRKGHGEKTTNIFSQSYVPSYMTLKKWIVLATWNRKKPLIRFC